MSGEYRGRRDVVEFLRRTGLETGGTYKSHLHTVFADDEWAVAIYRATGSRNGIELDVEQALVIRIADGLWQDVTAVPLDSAFERFWAEARSRLRLIEQLLPALEERRERVAAALVGGEHVDVRPVLGELLLELGDLGLARGDLRSIRSSSDARGFGAAFGFVGFGFARSTGGSGFARASRSSRARRSSAQPPSYARSSPSSIASVRSAIASSSARSCETSSTVPGNASSAASSASRLSRSRWLVGSSRTRKFAPEATVTASASRRRSPPESTETAFSCASQPEKRKRPSRFCASGRERPVIDWTHWRTEPRASSSISCCEK